MDVVRCEKTMRNNCDDEPYITMKKLESYLFPEKGLVVFN